MTKNNDTTWSTAALKNSVLGVQFFIGKDSILCNLFELLMTC